MSTFPAEDLIDRATRLLVAMGANRETARLVADGLVESDARGLPSHGLMLLPMYLGRIAQGSVNPTAQNRIIADLGALVAVDALNGLGQASAQKAMDLAIQRASNFGIGAVTCRNSFHFGGAYRYAALAAATGMIGIAAANTRPLMPVPGGSQAVVGNNPIAFAIPRSGRDPIVFDLALSEAALGKIRLAEQEGRKIPDNWATDSAGRPTTDPTAAIAGLLLPVGGAKGFGLALIIDMLTGVLSGEGFGSAVQGLYTDFGTSYNSAATFIAIDASELDPGFPYRVDRLADQVLAAPMADPTKVSRLPGDRSAQNRARSSVEGVTLAASVVADIEQWEKKLNTRKEDRE